MIPPPRKASPRPPTLGERASGILLHPTSLPGPHGCGDLGQGGHRFAEWLAEAGQRWWQVLPLGPLGYGNSPYSALSAFAGNPLLIGLDELGIDEVPSPSLPSGRVDYGLASAWRRRKLGDAFAARKGSDAPSFRLFCEAERPWLEDFALYSALKDAHGGRSWVEWSPRLRDRDPPALEDARRELAEELERRRWEQWIFEQQWHQLREHCAALGIGLIGDLPIFVSHDSADVWAHRELFFLDERGMPTVVAGVPPDYFSRTGQLWGNPLYRWDRLRDTGYAWWIDRLRQMQRRFDAIRLDHFIGFVRAWEIPAGDPTAENGRWREGPGIGLFRTAREALGELPMIAEDLGAVTPAVKALRDELGLPGIRLLQFAFGTDPQAPDFLPHAYPRNAVVYTGTHDNDTTVGWFEDPGGPHGTRTPDEVARERARALDYLGLEGAGEVHWAMIRAVLASVANVAIVPLQDVLGLGSEARMNRPGTLDGNWEWRVREADLDTALAYRLHRLVHTYGRDAGAPAAGIPVEGR
ncbi:4-alpha-glucanotransferase [Vulgatibacter incomptus]|uniref:4-alpha-glucanotransferase n=1 Tax=Vulgatibacter incomptus TaxID=1391653 RepID=A0A0K1PIE9_9BACT|nr:4-alpha-glucanotransferase [Vulgatibacter incomptus]AKU93290.1 4-alpha-glucanotransferase (amylomaltase) [Vulgatibacter incomptus]